MSFSSHPSPIIPDDVKTSSPIAAGKRLKFTQRSGLRPELNRRVDAYFTERGIARTAAGPTMWIKTAVLLGGLATSWTVLLTQPMSVGLFLMLTTLAGLCLAGIGFSVMHDGNHMAYSHRKRTNRIMGYTLDLVGGSSYMWRFKHNVMHHTYPNVEGLDDDIEAQPFLRMAEGQRRYPWHRLQHVYFWLAYALLPLKWHFLDDFQALFNGHLNGNVMPRPKGADLVALFAGKVFFFTWALAVPLTMHSIGWVVAAYAIMSGVAGITLGTVFQLAHCVEGASFSTISEDGIAALPWAEHQIETTVDFAPNSRLLTWYLGGLNFQVEHHLFPRVGHVHYPALAKIVQAVCAERGVTHRTKPTLWQALGGHVRYLKRMGAARS